MKPSVMLGVVVAVIVLAAWVVVPWLQPANEQAARNADRQAELARRQLLGYSSTAARLATDANMAALRAADLTKLKPSTQPASAPTEAQAAADQLADYLSPHRKTRRSANAGPVSPAEAREDFNVLAQYLEDNRKLLADALTTAKSAASEASQSGRPLASVYLMLGQVQMTTAEATLCEAEQLRRELDTALGRALALALELRQAQIAKSSYENLELQPILDDLNNDPNYGLTRAREYQQTAEAEVKRLGELAAARTSDLAAVRAELSAKNEERTKLEQTGFKLGDDQAFETYRQQYVALSNALRDLEAREQMLQLGARQDAQFAEDDPAAGALTGGEQFIGLEALQTELAFQQANAKRYAAAIAALEQHIAEIQARAADAQRGATGVGTKLDARAKELDALVVGIGQLATRAGGAESEALKAAQAARDAFAKASSATRDYVRDARELRTKYDATRANARLKAIEGDRYADQVGRAAEAAARLLEGRIHWQRLDGVTRQMEVYRRIIALRGAGHFEDTDLRAIVATSREEGTKTLEEARKTLEALANNGPPTTMWIPRGGEALALYLQSRLDETNRKQLEQDACVAIQKAVEKAEASPYLSAMVQFRKYLYAHVGYTPPPPPADAGATSEEATTPGGPGVTPASPDPNLGAGTTPPTAPGATPPGGPAAPGTPPAGGPGTTPPGVH